MTDNLVNRIIAEGPQTERVPPWSDKVTTRPIFTTVIDATGPRGNIVSIMSAAMSLLRQLGIPYDRIQELSNRVTEAQSYEDAVALVEKWFKVDRGQE